MNDFIQEKLYTKIKLSKFKNEKEIQEIIFENIKPLMREVFAEKVKRAVNEYNINKTGIRVGKKIIPICGARVDIMVQCESGNTYLFEIKNPSSGSRDTINAIGQILFYNSISGGNNRLVVISSIYEYGWKEVIKKYKLPIDFILITDDKIGLIKHNEI